MGRGVLVGLQSWRRERESEPGWLSLSCGREQITMIPLAPSNGRAVRPALRSRYHLAVFPASVGSSANLSTAWVITARLF